jgi:flagellar basal-body rod modification protein FlgD
MLIAQIQNQDPLDPIKNSEFVTQLAQINTVEQLQSVNKNLGYLQLYMASINNSQAIEFIGKEILASGDTVYWNGNTPSSINYSLNSNATSVVVNIYDTDGQLVTSIHQGEQDQGVQEVLWSGRYSDGDTAPEGTYRFEVLATDIEGNPVNSIKMLSGLVDGISFEEGICYVTVGGNKIPIGDIIEIRARQDTQEEQDEETGTMEKIIDTVETLGKTAAKVAPLLFM